MPRRLVVIEGADQGQSFRLPPKGTLLIGNSRKHCDICLNDLVVARVHCHLEIDGDGVLVRPLDTPTGVLVKGARVGEFQMHPGDVFRAGNTHLRLEESDGTEPVVTPGTAQRTEEAWKLVPLPMERLGELSGHPLGHYQLGEVLGVGHYGVVFRAKDLKKHEAVAVKVLAATFPANQGEIDQFVRVIKQFLPLRHPNLVALTAAGKNGPYFWLAQDLVEGESLTSVLEYLRTSAKIKWKRAWRVAVGLARVLDFLRTHHIVHNNITPRNIIIQASDGQPRLNGFFLTRALAGSKLQEDVLEKKVLAELPYLSPEQTDPEATPDDLSDQYAAGVVVYALLTGRPPFEGDTPADLVERIRSELPDNPKKYQRGIPDEFKAIVLKMLSKRPEDRYPAPAALMEDLLRLAEHEQES
jgi:serine/threonine protein kinase